MSETVSIDRPVTRKSWYPKEPECLLGACHQHKQIRLFLPHTAEPVYCTIPGFDVGTSEILAEVIVDRFSCSHDLLSQYIDSVNPVYLRIPNAKGHYFLQSTVKEVQLTPTGFQVLLRVHQDWVSAGKRLFPRVVFPLRQGPQVRVSNPWKPQLKAYLADISQFGCCLHNFGNDIRNDVDRNRVDLSIEFNEEFKLETHAKLKQVLFKRKPSCHNVLRILFTEMEKCQSDQLKFFMGNSVDFSSNTSSIKAFPR